VRINILRSLETKTAFLHTLAEMRKAEVSPNAEPTHIGVKDKTFHDFLKSCLMKSTISKVNDTSHNNTEIVCDKQSFFNPMVTTSSSSEEFKQNLEKFDKLELFLSLLNKY
jgi:hypothetical protein